MDRTPTLAPEAATAPELVCAHLCGARQTFRLHIPSTLIFCQGHFEGNPIVPAFVLIDWAIKYGGRNLEKGEAISGIARAKFIRWVPPGTTLDLTIEKKDRTLTFTYCNGAAVPFAQGEFILARMENPA